jgi:uncharacterized membrane protein HdeD (DUF308 family)
MSYGRLKPLFGSGLSRLGIFEIVLGAMLFISPLAYGPPVYWTAMIWALVGGGMIIGSAVFDRFKRPN